MSAFDEPFFDAEGVDVPSFDALPAGRYSIVVSKATKKESKDSKSTYVELELHVTDGEFKNRRIWDWCIIRHPNEQAVNIGKGRLASLCKAINVLKPRDASELCGIMCVATVKQRKNKDTGEMQNDVSKYSSDETDLANVAPPIAAPQAATSWGSGAKPNYT